MASRTPRCSAHSKQTGKPCGNYAMRGATVCRLHGGKAKQVQKAAKKRLEENKLRDMLERRLGEPIEVDPVTAILGRIHAKAAEVAWLRNQVQLLSADEDLVWGTTKVREDPTGGVETTEEPYVNLWLKLYHEAEKQLVWFSKMALDAGVDERRVRMEEAAASQLVLFANLLAEKLGIKDRDTYVDTVQGVLAEMTTQ